VKPESTDAPLFPDVPNSALETYKKPEVILPKRHVSQTIRAVVKALPIDQIEPRKKYVVNDEGDAFDALVANIKLLGMLEPIVVRETPGGNFRVIRGNRRLAAAQEIDQRMIEARILPANNDGGSELEDLYEIVSDEHHRQQLNPMDKAELVLDIVMLESGATEAEIRGVINRHSNLKRNPIPAPGDESILAALQRAVEIIGIRLETYRTEYLPILNLESDLKSALQNGVPKSLVLELKRVGAESERQRLLVEILLSKKSSSTRAIRAIINAELQKKSVPTVKKNRKIISQKPLAIGDVPAIGLTSGESELGSNRALLLAPIAAVIDTLMQLEQPTENNQLAADTIRDALKILRNALENRIEFSWTYARMSMEVK
jgi:ParB-like chromosome segregation protein Spo0J